MTGGKRGCAQLVLKLTIFTAPRLPLRAGWLLTLTPDPFPLPLWTGSHTSVPMPSGSARCGAPECQACTTPSLLGRGVPGGR